MRILLHDSTLYEPSSPLFLDAVRELGCAYRFVDEGRFLRPVSRNVVRRLVTRALGQYPPTNWNLNRAILREAVSFRPSIVLIVKGTYLAPGTLRAIKQRTSALLVNYVTDDPFNAAASNRTLRRSIRHYDLYVCPSRRFIQDVKHAGARRVAYAPFAYKPNVYYPESPQTHDERSQFRSDVVFIGGADEDRVRYFDCLVRRMPGIELALYGGYWPRYSQMRRYYRGVAMGRDYRLAVSGARIAVNIVRHSNRSDNTMRSFEIPACGGFMLTERTEQHLKLFVEGEEAAYFSSPEEMVEKVEFYLSNDGDRQRIAEAGFRKITTGPHTYKHRLDEILEIARGL